MDRLASTGSRRLQQEIMREVLQPVERVARRQVPVAMGPTLVKVENPLEDIEDIVERLDEASEVGRRRNKWLARRRGTMAVGRNRAGELTLDGRTCCYLTARALSTALPHLQLPYRHTCSCGVVWGLEVQVREERRHG